MSNNYSEKKIKIISAADSSHFLSLIQFILSFKKTKQTVPNIYLEIWDLGLLESELDFLNIYFANELKLISFPFIEYPEWININLNVGEYAWKPILIYSSVKNLIEKKEEFDCLFWMDSGNIISHSISLLQAFLAENLLYSPTSSGSVTTWTHAGMITYADAYFWPKYNLFLNQPNRNGAVFGFNIKNHKVLDFIKTFSKLAQEKNCIAPPGSSRQNHRQDQALFTLLYYQFVLDNSIKILNEYVGFTIHNDIDKKIERQKINYFPDILVPKLSAFDLSSEYEFSVKNLINFYKFKISGVLIAGAHCGQEVSDFDFELPFILVEPQEECVEKLIAQFGAFSNVKILNFALGDINEEKLFYIASNEGQSSSLNKPAKHLEYAPHVQFNKQMKVNVRTLDSLLGKNHRYNFWIVDVQGSELSVLKGSSNILKNVDYLYIEVNKDLTYENCSRVEDIDEYLRNFGLFRVITRWWDIWGDALYIRANLKSKDIEKF